MSKARRFFVTGTDTNIGKTVFSAMLVAGLAADYWKPVQSGLDGPSDTDMVRTLSGCSAEQIHPESYRLNAPLSPHRAAELDSVTIDPTTLKIPTTTNRLVIEGAGGLMVPLNRSLLLIDWLATLQTPVLLCARTALGTINHTLLSVAALRQRNIPLHGIAFIGDDNPDTIRTIGDFSGARILGRLPLLSACNPDTLRAAFGQYFTPADFA